MEMTTTQFVIHEEEMCQRLIQVSFAKIVNSKNERGGARLHKNLLILHLLQKARSEQRRSYSPPFEMREIPPSELQHQDEVEPEPEAENSANESLEESGQSLTDSVLELLEVEQEAEEQKVVDSENGESQKGYSFLKFVELEEAEEAEELGQDAREEPLFYPVASLQSKDTVEQGRGLNPLNPFLDPEDLEEEEAGPKVIVQSATEEFLVRFGSEEEEEVGEEAEETEETDEKPRNLARNKLSSASSQSSGYDSGSSSGSSSSSDEEEIDKDTLSYSFQTSTNQNRRKRKRRCSSTERQANNNNNNNNSNPCCVSGRTNKKCCTDMDNTIDNAQLSGLISVFNSGLASLQGQKPASDSSSPLPADSDAPSPSLPCCHSVAEMDICGANGVPCRSMSCPSFRELACES